MFIWKQGYSAFSSNVLSSSKIYKDFLTEMVNECFPSLFLFSKKKKKQQTKNKKNPLHLHSDPCEYLYNFWVSLALLCWFLLIPLSHPYPYPLLKKLSVLALKFLNQESEFPSSSHSCRSWHLWGFRKRYLLVTVTTNHRQRCLID